MMNPITKLVVAQASDGNKLCAVKMDGQTDILDLPSGGGETPIGKITMKKSNGDQITNMLTGMYTYTRASSSSTRLGLDGTETSAVINTHGSEYVAIPRLDDRTYSTFADFLSGLACKHYVSLNGATSIDMQGCSLKFSNDTREFYLFALAQNVTGVTASDVVRLDSPVTVGTSGITALYTYSKESITEYSDLIGGEVWFLKNGTWCKEYDGTTLSFTETEDKKSGALKACIQATNSISVDSNLFFIIVDVPVSA